MKKILVVAGLLPASPEVVQSQWSVLPDGNYPYSADVTWGASFACGGAILIGSCTSGGSSLVLERDGATATFTFLGASCSQLFSPAAPVPAAVGTMSVLFGAGPFQWPAMQSVVSTFLMRLTTTSTVPGPASATYRMGFHLATPTTLVGNSDNRNLDWLQFPIAVAPPPGAGRYGAIFEHISYPEFTAGGTQRSASRQPGILIPEPSTTCLLATVGLLMRKRGTR